MQAKPQSQERSRRIQTIWFTIAGAAISAALVAGMIYFLYQTSHLRR